MATNSPSKSRLTKLSYKFEELQPAQKTDKNPKVDNLEQQCHNLQEKMAAYLESNNKDIKAIKEKIVEIKQTLGEEKAERHKLLEVRYNDIAKIENRIAQLVENEMRAKKDSDQRLGTLINQRYNELKEYLRKETAIREENIDLINSTLESDLPKLSEGIKTEAAEQAEADAALHKKFQDEVNSLKQFVDSERKQREDSEKTISEMLRSVFAKVKEDIELERKNREATEETLMNLLEETCKKVNDATHM